MIGAVDIGGTKIAVGAIHESGRIAARTEWPTSLLPEPEDAVVRMAEWLTGFSMQTGEVFPGVGVACTGPVDPKTGIVGDVDLLPGWKNFALAQRLSVKLTLPVAVENDADAAALAEVTWGAGRGASRFLYITVSTGIGAGVVLDGRLYRGVAGSHPEIGHQTLDPAGALCSCGAMGCWEALASGPAMVKWVQANAGPESRFALDVTARDICDMARNGDEAAKRAVEREAEWLGIGIANLVTIFCPDVIALGGGVMQSADLFLERIRGIVAARCSLVPFQKSKIVPASLGTGSALLGAGRVWQARHEQQE